mgnify:CR=1 FL=1
MTDSRLKIDIRRKRILEQLRLEGKVSVGGLCEALGVTPVTIRNDLTMLEQEGEKATFCYLRTHVLKGKPFPWEKEE